MSSIDDLVQWMREQIASDRAHAEKDLWCVEQANEGDWTAHFGTNLQASYLHIDGGRAAMFSGWAHQENLMLVTRFKPSTVATRAQDTLARCDAYETLLDRWTRLADAPSNAHGIEFVLAELRNAVITLTVTYRHRPGYREEWRP